MKREKVRCVNHKSKPPQVRYFNVNLAKTPSFQRKGWSIEDPQYFDQSKEIEIIKAKPSQVVKSVEDTVSEIAPKIPHEFDKLKKPEIIEKLNELERVEFEVTETKKSLLNKLKAKHDGSK